MVAGTPIQEPAWFLLCALMLLGGLVLLFLPRIPIVGTVDIEWPKKFKVPLRALPIMIGAVLSAIILWLSYGTPQGLPISGTVLLRERQPIAGLLVGVLPSSHLTSTLPDGSYSLTIAKGKKGTSYQAVIYFPSDPPQFKLGVVRFTQDGEGRFDDVLTTGR